MTVQSREGPDTPAAEPYPEPLIGWQKVVYVIVIAIGALTAVAAALMVARELWNHPSFSKPVITVYVLVIVSWAAFFLAAVWFAGIVQFTAPKEVRLRHRHGGWRHVGYQIAVFLILALSLRAFVHDAEAEGDQPTHAAQTATSGFETGQPKGTKPPTKTKHVMLTASELAAIMILFALAELAALLGKDVAQATDEIENVKREANLARTSMEYVRTSLDKSRSEIEKSQVAIQEAISRLQLMQVPQAVEKMHTDVKSEVIALLEAWSKRAPSHYQKDEDPLLHLAWRIFIREYVCEEAADFQPKQLQTEGVPIAAQPYPTVGQSDGSIFNVTGEAIAYVATNVGFYARFLDRLVSAMTMSADGQHISVAVLTTVLPAYWWNWPRSTGRLLAYSPIEELRKTMAEMPERVRSDRLILVREVGGDQPASLSPAVENALEDEGLLHQMESWWVAGALAGTDLLPCSEKLSKDEQFSKLAAKMPDSLRESVIKNGGSIHPLFTERPADPIVMDDRNWNVRPLIDDFMGLHKGGGNCWALPVSSDYLVKEMDGRYDFTFIGVSDTEAKGKLGAWSDDSIEWKFCLMTSASDKNETMFMTLVGGDAAAMQMKECRRRLKDGIGRARPLIKRDPPAPCITAEAPPK